VVSTWAPKALTADYKSIIYKRRLWLGVRGVYQLNGCNRREGP
jgi:hypothetical protein